jgi:cytochrome c biogenesis protein CcdA
MNDVADLFRGALSGGSLAALPLAIAGGFVTGLNPCCLSFYPAAAATCCATRGERLSSTFWSASAFALGIALATTLLGVLAAAAGRVMTGVGGWSRYVIAAVPLVMAMHVLGWIRLPIPMASRNPNGRGVASSFLAGLLLSLVLVPCGTPLLASVLSYAAYEGSVPYGGMLLFLYGIGAALPVLVVATTAGGLAARLDGNGWRPWVDRVTGAVLLALGLYLLWIA